MSSRRINRHPRATKRRCARAQRAAAFAPPERLEPRLALATDLSVELVGDVLRIDGTEGSDAIFVRRRASGIVLVDYSSGNNIVGHRSFPTGVGKVEVRGRDGRDMIVLRVGDLIAKTVVASGPGDDLIFSRGTVEVSDRDPTGRDILAPIVDRSLPAGVATTTRRTEKPDLVHESTYSGQSLVASRTRLADGGAVEVSFDARGAIVRDTFLGSRLVLSESWDLNGGYQRTVTDVDGTRLRETFEKGTLQIEEREQDGRSATTLYGANGAAIRHSVAGGKMQAEEVWDGAGGYRRTWVDDAGRVIKEVFENGKPVIKTISSGRRVARSGTDAEGNRVSEVLVDGVLVLRKQWDTTGGQLITRFNAGVLASRETFQGARRVQLEEWAEGRLVRTAWNASGDRLVQTLVGGTRISEEEIRGSGERRLTQWVGGETIRTTTDTAGNVSVEKLAGERLLSRELRSADGSLALTTFDPFTGQPATEERSLPGGRQVQRTFFSSSEVRRFTLQDGVIVLRERWWDGGLRRVSDNGAGTVRVERFTGSDRATLAEGTKVADTVTTAGGEQLKTVWDPDGTRRVTGSKDGILVLEELQVGSVLTKIIHGGDGSMQEEVFESGLRTKLMQLAGDGSYREQRFTSAGMKYELLRNPDPNVRDGRGPLGSFKETTWSRGGHWGADQETTVLFASPGTSGGLSGGAWRNSRIRTVSGPGFETRQLWWPALEILIQ